MPGELCYDGVFPLGGLTIRVRFDPEHVPAAAWWYAEATERERTDRPAPGDRRLLPITATEINHTFTEMACQPRESYGIGWEWSTD